MESIESKAQPQRLPHPVRLTEQTWPEGTAPTVSVFCITYNHANFIREAIEGFLMQETTFPVEIFIHDDASSDGTAEIIKEYATKHPQLFWTVFQNENQWSKGNKRILNEYLGRQRGDFVALCEGDDYWTIPEKLQRQVSVLEADPQSAGVFHQTERMRGKGGVVELVTPANTPLTLNFADIVLYNTRATCSLVYRRKFVSAQDLSWIDRLPMGDWPLQVELASIGHWRYLDETMAVYRQHDSGAWSSRGQKGISSGTLQFYDAVVSRFGARASAVVNGERKKLQQWLMCEALGRHDFIRALGYLLKYLFTPPRRFRLPSFQNRLVSA